MMLKTALGAFPLHDEKPTGEQLLRVVDGIVREPRFVSCICVKQISGSNRTRRPYKA